jgi:membrane-associated protein
MVVEVIRARRGRTATEAIVEETGATADDLRDDLRDDHV